MAMSPWALMNPGAFPELDEAEQQRVANEEAALQNLFAKTGGMTPTPEQQAAWSAPSPLQLGAGTPFFELPAPTQMAQQEQPIQFDQYSRQSSGPSVLPQNAYDDLIKRINSKGLESQGIQREGIEALKKRLADLQGAQTNKGDPLARALTMAADVWGGGQGAFTKMYEQANPNMTEAQKQEAILKLEDMLRKSRGELAGSEIDLLKAQLGYQIGKDKLSGKAAVDEAEVLKTKESQTLQAGTNFQNSLAKYNELIDKYGTQMTGEGRKKLESAYADLKIKYKEAANLGALTGPDMDIIMEAVAPATGLSGFFGEKFKGGVEGIKGSLQQLGQRARVDAQTQLDMLKTAYPGSRVVQQIEGKLNKFGQPVGASGPWSRYSGGK